MMNPRRRILFLLLITATIAGDAASRRDGGGNLGVTASPMRALLALCHFEMSASLFVILG
jgi:hypothetical protein